MIHSTHKFKADLDALDQIRNLLSVANEEVGLDKKKLYRLLLAVDEIATNIINYGYIEKGNLEGFFDLELNFQGKQFVVTLIDSAAKFDPFLHTTPSKENLELPLEERPIGGLGIMMAQKSVDEYKYEFSDNKNRNVFIVNI